MQLAAAVRLTRTRGRIAEFDSKIKHDAGDVDHAIATGHRQTHTFIVGVAASRLRRRQPCNEAMTVLTVACLALQATNTAGRSPQEPTAVLLAKLPELATREWATRKVRIAKEAEVLSKRREAQLSMQQKAVVARIEEKISDSDFEGLKRSVAEETFKIEAQIAELDREKSTFEELTKQANAQVLNLAQSWIRAGPREKQELQWALFPEGISYDPQKRFFAPANVSLVQLLNELLTPSVKMASPTGFEPVLPP